MKIRVYSESEELYVSLIEFLKDVKYSFGGSAVRQLLKNHPEIDKYLLNRHRAIARDFDDKIKSLHFDEVTL